MPVQGTPKQFLKRFKFVIECDRLGDTGFQKCSEIESTIEANEYAEGGAIFNEKDAGRISFNDVTIERGQTIDDNDMESWHTEAGAAANDLGGVGDSYKANLDIVNNLNDLSAARTYRLHSSWPSQVKVGPWDNDSSEHTFSMAVIKYNYFTRLP